MPLDHTEPVLLVRKRGDLVGEWERSCHLAALPEDGTRSTLITLCGERIEVSTAELLPEPEGMPCVACLLSVPPPRG
ncbi:hypothetical protein B0I31_12769 [Saccharothrix carnea]|uniref:Uncharacterized protein n=1 Tax=Saccharothrix carnea TaxID=1280637 RepID=A0A2P8HGE5_SACCR|nr:hypothetical protein [Saccharothrix carnea]PSL45292.1 hypothetical protein B0I31_12769 [Saccharothrix carnea]